MNIVRSKLNNFFCFLAFHALGTSGKTVVELSIILLMIGTCIAFFVVMGDLGPAIVGSLLQVDHSYSLRPTVLIGKIISTSSWRIVFFLDTILSIMISALAIFVVLPLGLLRNIDSLSTICTMSFLFYLLLVFKVWKEEKIRAQMIIFGSPSLKILLQVFIESMNNLFAGSWIEEIHYWRPSGILQCLPIFSMALSCQT